MEKKVNTLNEAPASATVKVKSKNGFEWLFTMRDDTVSSLINKIETMEGEFIKKSWTPLAQNSFSKPQAPTKTCPIHKVDMKEKVSQKTGRKYFSHYRGTFPNGESCFGQGFASEKPSAPEGGYNEGEY